MRFAALIFCLIFSSSAFSAKAIQSYRCGNGLLKLGMDTVELRKTCGKKWVPAEIRTEVKWYKTPRAIKHFVGSLPASANTYQFWIYREYGKFEMWVWVTRGRIAKFEKRGRVG